MASRGPAAPRTSIRVGGVAATAGIANLADESVRSRPRDRSSRGTRRSCDLVGLTAQPGKPHPAVCGHLSDPEPNAGVLPVCFETTGEDPLGRRADYATLSRGFKSFRVDSRFLLLVPARGRSHGATCRPLDRPAAPRGQIALPAWTSRLPYQPTTQQIDAVVALAIAVECAERPPPERRSWTSIRASRGVQGHNPWLGGRHHR